MTTPRVAAAIVRFQLRPVRRVIENTLRGSSGRGRTWAVRIGPTTVGDRQVVLRSPHITDGPAWCALRLQDQRRIEPWWISSALTWDERHTPAEWTSLVLTRRRVALQGRSMPLVIEVDGRIAGELSLEWVDEVTGSAELGIWIHSRQPGRGRVVAAAARMLFDYAFGVLGLHRLTAPIAVGNLAAEITAGRFGMVCEGTLENYLDVGGSRRDHRLWTLTPQRHMNVTDAPGMP